MRKVWEKWITFTKKIIGAQATVLLLLIYALIIFPLGVFFQLFFKKKLLGHSYNTRSHTYWIKKQKRKQDISFAYEQ